MAGLLLIFIPFSAIFTAIAEAIKPGVFSLNLNIDENLSNYFEALEQDDKKWMILEEENLRRNYVIDQNFLMFIFIEHEDFA
jgi:hypothetical protein